MSQDLEQARSACIEHHFQRAAGGREAQALAGVASISYGITLGGHRTPLPEQRAYLRVANVLRESLDLSEVKNINCTPDEAVRFALANGDVLIVEGHASVKEIGRAAVWRSELRDTLHQNHLIRVRCSNTLLPEYLSLYVNSLRGRSYFRSRAKSSSGLNTINSTVVKELPVPQTTRREQEALLSSIQDFDSALAAESSTKTALQKILSGILNEVIA
jgi:restriction endonuclease S subunit